MKNIFISGSMRIKNINKQVINRIDNIVKENFTIFIGDANGVDASIQGILSDKSYRNVLVFCTVKYARNNIGRWEVRVIETDHKPNTRSFFTAKDLAMAEKCDFGLMIWDSKSTGTLSNVYELLLRNKTSVVFVNKIKKFVKVSSLKEFEQLISFMSDSALQKANQKIKLKEKLVALKNRQLDLFPEVNKANAAAVKSRAAD